MDKHIVEDMSDFMKISLASAPPSASFFFGLPLQEWMYIASIVASLFFILDKLPQIASRMKDPWNRIYAKFKKQSHNGGSSDSSNNAS